MNNLPKPETPTINVPLLRKTLEYIEAHPEEWVQCDWRTLVQRTSFCGTAYCFAGTAANLNGVEWRNPAPKSDLDDYGYHNHMVVTSEGEVTIGEYAREILGLNVNQAFFLFGEFNTLGDLQRIVAGLIAEAEASS